MTLSLYAIATMNSEYGLLQIHQSEFLIHLAIIQEHSNWKL